MFPSNTRQRPLLVAAGMALLAYGCLLDHRGTGQGSGGQESELPGTTAYSPSASEEAPEVGLQAGPDGGPDGASPGEADGGRHDVPGETDGGPRDPSGETDTPDADAPGESDGATGEGDAPPVVELPPHFVATGETRVSADNALGRGATDHDFEPVQATTGCPTGAVVYWGKGHDDIKVNRTPHLSYAFKTSRAERLWVWLGTPGRDGKKAENWFWVWVAGRSQYLGPQEVAIDTQNDWNWAKVGPVVIPSADEVEVRVAGYGESSALMELRLGDRRPEPDPPEEICWLDE